MSKISKKFNWLLILSVSISVLISSVFTTAYLMVQMSRDFLEKDRIQVIGLSNVIENFLNHASTLNYQLSQHPDLVNKVMTAPSDWAARSSEYAKAYSTETSFNLNTGDELLVKNQNEYEFVELFFLQDMQGNQIARSFGPLGQRGERWWFREFTGIRNNQSFLSKSYYSMTGNIPVSSFFHPVYRGTELIGILGMDINFRYIQNLVEKQIHASDMYAVVVDSEGVIIAHPDSERVSELTNLAEMTKHVLLDDGKTQGDGHHKTEVKALDMDSRISAGVKKALNGELTILEKISWNGRYNNIYMAPVEISGMFERYAVILVHDNTMMNRARNLIILFCLFAILVTILLVYNLFRRVFSRTIIKPLEVIIDAMSDIDFENYREIVLVTHNEFDLLAGTYNRLRHKLRKANKQLKEQIIRLEDSRRGYRALADTGLALAVEKNRNHLLETIVTQARILTNSEGGTLYLYNSREDSLYFSIMQNDVLDINLGVEDIKSRSTPPVPLHVEGKPNRANVSSYSALTSKIINIPDVYETEEFDFHGMKEYDRNLGYRSRSMLVIPMKNMEGELIGVIQLINPRSEPGNEIKTFTGRKQNLVTALAAQAAAVITNIQLNDDLKSLFYSFQRSIATAIDKKSPFTGGHIKRVVMLIDLITGCINESSSGFFSDFNFSPDEMEELKVAAWMHDVGKITTPEHIMNKSSRLNECHDGIEVIKCRFHLAEYADGFQWLKDCPEDLKIWETDSYASRLKEDRSFLESCNTASYIDDESLKRLNSIGQLEFTINGCTERLLKEHELNNLSIRKGTLNREERQIMENHVVMTRKILENITFPQNMRNVCDYASLHHEKLNGSGYPVQLRGEEIPLQARIIVFSDIMEALTASDRPYRKHLPLEKAMNIIENMVESGELDRNIYELFTSQNLIEDYFRKTGDWED